MRQYFPNGAMVEGDKSTGNATIYWDGWSMVSFGNIKVTELTILQNIANKWTSKDATEMSDASLKERFKRGVLLTWNRYNIVTHEEIKNI